MKRSFPESSVALYIKNSSDIHLSHKALVMLVVKILTYLVNSQSLMSQHRPRCCFSLSSQILYILHPPCTSAPHLQAFQQLDWSCLPRGPLKMFFSSLACILSQQLASDTCFFVCFVLFYITKDQGSHSNH